MKQFPPRLLAALLLAGSLGQVQAATSEDDGAQGFHTGTGAGDLVLALRAGTKSITWDLSGTINGGFNDLTVNDILALAAAGKNFELTNASLSQFLVDNPTTDIQWNVFGISNKGRDFSALEGPIPDQVGIVSTRDQSIGVPTLPTGGNLGISLQSNAQWILDNVQAGLTDNGTVIANSAGDDHFFLSPSGRHGTDIADIDATADSFGEALALHFLRKDPSRRVDTVDPQEPGADELPVLSTLLGNFSLSLTGSTAKLAFTAAVQPIPLPAAGWLLGAALAGLGGIARRRG